MSADIDLLIRSAESEQPGPKTAMLVQAMIDERAVLLAEREAGSPVSADIEALRARIEKANTPYTDHDDWTNDTLGRIAADRQLSAWKEYVPTLIDELITLRAERDKLAEALRADILDVSMSMPRDGRDALMDTLNSIATRAHAALGAP